MSPVIEIIVKTNEPGLSKSIGDSILSQLSLAVNEYKLKKVNDRISFIKSRLFNVKQELNQTEENLNNFREKNRVVFNSPSLLLQEERLQRDVLLHNQIFTSLSTELETEQINQYGIKESFEILDYPENMGRVFPNDKNTIFLSILLGIIFSLIYVFGKFSLQQMRKY